MTVHPLDRAGQQSPPPAPAVPPTLATVLAQSGAENFPVASRLLPARFRRDLLGLYAFARFVDDVGDEVDGDRSALLDAVEADLRRLPAGEPRLPAVRAVAPLVRARGVPVPVLLRLVEANRQDQVVAAYATWADLQAYCRLSADPVGEVVLHVFDAATADRLAWSSSVCTALQLVEHLQDVGEDRRRGRVYLPQEDLARFGCAEADLDAATASPALRAVMAFEAERAGQLLRAGQPLVRSLRGWARVAVAGYVAGGLAALAAIRRADGDVLGADVRPGRARTASEALRLVAGGSP